MYVNMYRLADRFNHTNEAVFGNIVGDLLYGIIICCSCMLCMYVHTYVVHKVRSLGMYQTSSEIRGISESKRVFEIPTKLKNKSIWKKGQIYEMDEIGDQLNSGAVSAWNRCNVCTKKPGVWINRSYEPLYWLKLYSKGIRFDNFRNSI